MSRLTDYYHELRDQYSYTSVDSALGEMSAAEARRRFAFADGLDSVALDSERTPISTGISPTGPPHVGTLGQLLTALALRDAGFDVRAVFADLVVYHAHGVPIEDASALAERYREFALALGFDSDELAVQSDAHGVLHTAQLLARYHDFDESEEDAPEPPAFETALAETYEAADESPVASEVTVSPTAFAHEQASHLLVADQLHPLVAGNYDTVVFVGGADNHRLAAGIRDVLDRSPYSGTLVGCYTRLVGGYDGYPKLSKSIPASRFTLDAPPKRIRERVLHSGEEYD